MVTFLDKVAQIVGTPAAQQDTNGRELLMEECIYLVSFNTKHCLANVFLLTGRGVHVTIAYAITNAT